MPGFQYSAPKLDTSFAGAIGKGFQNAGLMVQNQGQSMIENDLAEKRQKIIGDQQALRTREYNDKRADRNSELGAFAQAGLKAFPELASQSGYDNDTRTVFSDAAFGQKVKAKLAIDAAKTKPQVIEGVSDQYSLDADGNVRPLNVGVYRDPYSGLTSDEKFAANHYGKNTPEYFAYLDNVAANKQMKPMYDPSTNQIIYNAPANGIVVRNPQRFGTPAQRQAQPYTYSQAEAPVAQTQVQEAPKTIKPPVKTDAPKPDSKVYDGVSATIGFLTDLDYLKDNYRDSYVGITDGTLNTTLNKLGVPEMDFLGNKGFAKFQQALANLNNKERNALMGAVLTPQEISEYNKQSISERDDNQSFKAKMERKTQILEQAFERKYNEIADNYGEEIANQMFETSSRLKQFQSNRQERRAGRKSNMTIQDAQRYMEELRRAEIIK